MSGAARWGRNSARSRKACPRLDRGWEPVFGQDHAQKNVRAGSAPIEQRPPARARGEHEQRLPHAAAVLEAAQAVRNRVLPNGKVRAAAAPGSRVGIAAPQVGYSRLAHLIPTALK